DRLAAEARAPVQPTGRAARAAGRTRPRWRTVQRPVRAGCRMQAERARPRQGATERSKVGTWRAVSHATAGKFIRKARAQIAQEWAPRRDRGALTARARASMRGRHKGARPREAVNSTSDCGHSKLPRLMTPSPETLRDGRYALTRKLGEGGQAATFE